MKSRIEAILKHKKIHRKVYLNRKGKNKGTCIGSIIEIAGHIFYYTERRPQHFYIKNQGYAIDRAIIKKIIEIQDDYSALLSKPRLTLWVLIYYRGKKKRKLLVADPWMFIEKGVFIEYAKDTGESIETYGGQLALAERDMQLWIEENIF